MTILKKLTEKLCEVESIREDIMELRFGCKVRCFVIDFWYSKDEFIKTYWTFDERQIKPAYCKNTNNNWVTDFEDGVYYDNRETIWNPIQLHHLLWYCGSNSKRIVVRWDWVISDVDNWIDICKYDVTKDLSNQSEEVLEKIYNFITQQ